LPATEEHRLAKRKSRSRNCAMDAEA